VIGSDNEMGSPVRDGVDGALAGVDTLDVEVTGAGVAGLTAGAGAGAGVTLGTVVGAGAGAGAGAVALGTVTVVVGVVAAPAGLTPANTVAAAKTRPPAATASEERGFRLNVLLHSVYGLHRPALSPQLLCIYPRRETAKPPGTSPRV
jgi:hypothetical protein